MRNTGLLINTSLPKPNNETISSEEATFYDYTTGIVILVFLLLLIVGGNSLVIAAYATNRRLRIGTYLFVVSLALSDLLVGGVALPIRIFGSIEKWQVSPKLMIFYNALDIFSAVASNLHLMALAFERFIAVSRPFYHQTLSVRPYVFASVLSWGLAAFVAALHPGNYLQDGGDIQLKIKIMQIHAVLLFTVCFVGPVLVISIVNIGIFQVAKALIRRTPSQHGYSDLGRKIRRERKTAMTLVLMSSFFFIAWFPFFIVNLLYLYCLKCLPSSNEAQFLLVDIVKWLHYSNSAVNPAIYAFRDAEMRKSFAKLLGPFGRIRCFSGQVLPESQSTQNTLDMQMRRPEAFGR